MLTRIVFISAAIAGFQLQAAPDLRHDFLDGPMKEVAKVVFAARKLGVDGHWYANFGYYAPDPNRKAYAEGAKLCIVDVRSGQRTTLLEDPRGGIRDPQVHYEAEKILFSYRPGGTEHYHLHEINLGGTGLRQLTSGPYDDIEPTYMPSGEIVFVSSRCNRWVNCWLTQVAVLHRCDADGENIRPISSNNEHDNTPWPMSDGRILYTRWEYVDRSQVHFHHLWAANPDGTTQMTWYGNMHPGITMIDAKPVPGSDKVVASFSPGHGQREHDGVVTLVDPNRGPDAKESAITISRSANFRDPWAFTESAFMAARGPELVLMNEKGETQQLLKLTGDEIKAGLQCHEPRPVMKRMRERILQDRVQPEKANGTMLLADVQHGRRMEGIGKGEIKKLLVLETLPMPAHFTGGMEPMSYGGTFTLERILGTVPVEEDGSAYFELPALRSVFFVALDENDMAVKRMQSFTSVQPGERASCVGCHEHRSQTPLFDFRTLAALRKEPEKITPIKEAPDVIDYPRDVQPILNSLCADCHGYEKTARGGPAAGKVILTGDHGPLYSHSYYTMTIRQLFSDGRNQPKSNYEPRALGSSSSRILKMLDESHYGVQATGKEKKMLRLWIDSGAAYPGTYAALACGMIGNYIENAQVNTGAEWPETHAATDAINRRCLACHNEPSRLLPKDLADEREVSFWMPGMDDPRLNSSRHIVWNLSIPEKSLMLLAPLATSAGGFGWCRELKSTNQVTVFSSESDPDYQKLYALAARGQNFLAENKRFDVSGFTPKPEWVREMKRYGIIPEYATAGEICDPYKIEQLYWRSLWYQPRAAGGSLTLPASKH
ncbi:MAG: HzsA-related protein [Limisphaerales bacterium]